MLTKLKVGIVLTIVLSLLALGSSCSKDATNDALTTNDSAATGKAYTSGDGSAHMCYATTCALRLPRTFDTSLIRFADRRIRGPVYRRRHRRQ